MQKTKNRTNRERSLFLVVFLRFKAVFFDLRVFCLVFNYSFLFALKTGFLKP